MNLANRHQRVDLEVLLVSADGGEPSYHALRSALETGEVPFTTVMTSSSTRLTRDMLSSGHHHARYQAVLLATANLVSSTGRTGASTLHDDDWSALDAYEMDFGLRRVSAYAYPTAALGLDVPLAAGPMAGTVGELTEAGRRVFPYLSRLVPFHETAYGYLARPLPGGGFETLVAGPDDTALVGVQHHADGREELIVTVDSNAAMLHAKLLFPGIIGWATRNVHLGHRRNYLSVQVDDVFMSNDRWVDPADGETADPSLIRMTDDDVTAAVAWSEANGVRLDLAFNGAGSGFAAEPPVADPLSEALLDRRDRFGWVNHTFTHLQLDEADRAEIASDIRRNIEWASECGIGPDPGALVTGEHSGLASAKLRDALVDCGVRWVAADASRGTEPGWIGSAWSVPRHPTNLYANTGTRAEQLGEYNAVYSAGATNGQGVGWEEFVAREASTILAHILANDPRPHYVHQNNLAEDRLLYAVLDKVLRLYRAVITEPLVQPTLSAAGVALQQHLRWRAARSADLVSAHVQNGEVVITAKEAVSVPVTGSVVGEDHAGTRSGWLDVAAGETVSIPLAVRAADAVA